MVIIKQLSNGIPVIMEPIEYLHSASFGVYVKTGSAYENAENNGISHMLEHMFFKSTKNRTARQIAEEMALLGGSLNAFTEKESTSFYVTTLSEQIPEAIGLIGDMLTNPLFLPEELEKEKSVVLEEIDMYDDSPDDLVHEMLQKEAWKDAPLGYIISGERENVKHFTQQQLFAYKEEMYTSDRMVLSIAGKFSEEEVLAMLEKCFSSFTVSKENCVEMVPVYRPVVYKRVKDMEQVHLNIAFPCISYLSDDKYALYLLNTIFGGEDNSRLFQRLREDAGLAYSIYSYESIYETAGLFHIDAVLNPSKLDKAMEEIEKAVAEICENGVTEKELKQAKQLLKTDLIIGNESTKSKIYNNGKAYLTKGYIKSTEEVCEEIYKVTCEEIRNFAGKYLKWNEKSVSLVGNIKG